MRKKYLLAPGPTPIPETVASVFTQPILHHRTPEFQQIFAEVRTHLKTVFQTQNEVLILSASGTGAMESTLTNLFSRGDQIIVINVGKFGERWTQIAQRYELKVVEVRAAAGQSVDLSELEKVMQTEPRAKAVCFQASETSTGVALPTREICQLTHRMGMLSICDAITACGVSDLPMDAWNIDVMMTGSQKAFMIPPGLAMIALNEKAWKLNQTAQLPRFYFDLAKEKKSQAKNQTAWTPAISLIVGLQASLRLMQEEGLQNIFKRHDLLARATRAAVAALNLELLAKASPSTAVSAVCVPAQIPDGKLIPKMMRDQYGVTIAGGQDELEGKIFRLSHFGYCDRFDITVGISALELVLNRLGHSVPYGTGVGAALQVFAQE